MSSVTFKNLPDTINTKEFNDGQMIEVGEKASTVLKFLKKDLSKLNEETIKILKDSEKNDYSKKENYLSFNEVF